MKKSLLLVGLLTALCTTLHAQSAPTFTKDQQSQIKKILGSAYTPIFSSNGELSIATKTSVSHVRALGGGISKSPGSVANNILVHGGWVLATSKKVLDAMKSKLGGERFSQLEAIVSGR
ncbi:hypothetical protein GCM10028805_23810 [Spirosoma harenae]